MAREHYPPAFSKDQEILKYLKGLEDDIKLLKNRTTSTLQQIAVADIDDPIEGEHVIDYTDDQHKWYSNGAWRQAPAAGDATWPTQYIILPWLDQDMVDNDYTTVFDTTSVLGAYARSTSNGNDYTSLVRLGPYGSRWGLEVIADMGLDFGIISYQFATADENDYGDGRYTIAADGSFATLQSRTFYRNPAIKNQQFNERAFRVLGADGAILTSIGASDPPTGDATFNGGAGPYLFRLLTNGRDGASSGFRTQIEAVILRRFAG